ncbi:MAG: ATP-dependent RecD-like DNA helicase [Clostridia bacterium]|nr:ATP-dependent RecD-like DNA helicase [Clostridia bacterium]
MTIRGDIDEIRFRNEENGFTIVVLDVEGEPVIATGVFPPVVEGQTVELLGSYIVHKRYGRQFKVEKCSICRPSGIDGIVRYLGSGLIHGIGPVLALRIVSLFGENTFSVIENAPHRLAEVKGISKQRAGEIAAAYSEIKAMQDAIMTLQSFDIPLGTAMKIYKVYGDETEEVITKNPYRLVEDVDGIGFITADRIATKTGIEKDSEFRIGAGVIYVLKESVNKSGNTCYPKGITIAESTRLLGVEEEKVESVVEDMLIERRLREVEQNDERLLTLPSVFHCEKNVAVLLSKLVISADATAYDVTGDIAHYEKINNITLHPTQKDAVESAFNSGVVVVTGGPGTGKTTIIKCIIDLFEKLNKKITLMAPTGRAAKRMNEATGRDASTIHRACGLGSGAGWNSDEKLYSDVFIIDEFSMVDIFLFDALLKKIPSGARLVLVGDKDQLPSVGAGNVLADVMRSGVVPTVNLTHIYRQAQESLIVTNAHAVNRGEMPVLDVKDKDFFYLSARDSIAVAQKTVDMVERSAKFIGVDPRRVQVLCPMKNGPAGAINVNILLQNKLNPDGQKSLIHEDYTYHEGDKVMHVVNNYDLEWKITVGYTYREGVGVFNGDIGEIINISNEKNEMTVLFEDGRQAVYTPDIFNQLVLAYAITVHKSQGSEFDAVVLPITAGGPMIMTRNLLYTAITRAKKMVVLIGDTYNVKRMVDNDYIATRYSLLCDLLIKEYQNARLLFG